MKEIQYVRVWVSQNGDYCAFHENSMYVEYDITNNKQIGDYTIEEMENHDCDYSDYQICNAVLIGGKYYISIDSL